MKTEQLEERVLYRIFLLEKSQQAANFLFFWLLTLSAGTLGLSMMVGDYCALCQVLFDVASALSNVGLSTGITGADMPQNAKYLLSLLMWLGRLEIRGDLAGLPVIPAGK